MKNILRILLRSSSDIYVELRKVFWSLSIKKQHHLKVLKDKKFHFTNFGDIVRILYLKQHLVAVKRSFEYDTLDLFKNSIKEGSVIVDIGANVGLFSLLGSDIIGSSGKILAIEPSKQVFDHLNKNLELNNITNVITANVALGEQESFISMVYPEKNNKDKNDAYGYIDTSNKGTIKCVVLDELLKKQNIEKVDLIKIDVEGAELLCLKGAKDLLKNHKPIIIFESHEPFCERFDYNIFDLLTFLSSFGYEVKQIDHAQWIAR